jgi:formylglycine-generating enzyme required for sulfatase activity
MRFPYEDDDGTDPAMRRFPRILVIGFGCLLLLGLFGVWKLLPSRTAPISTAPTSTVDQTRNDNSLNATLVWIPAGTFAMGSAKNENNGPNVGSQVTVTLTKAFWLGQTEVTQGQWQRVMHTKPWSEQPDVLEGDDYPVTFVSWRDATAFCKQLTQEERTAGRLPPDWDYTLPTEAQWEFACRAGTTTRFSFGDNGSDLGEYAWFADNANNLGDRYPHKAGQKKANQWGLYECTATCPSGAGTSS